MSIQGEIDRIKRHVASVYEAVEAKGGTLPNTQTSANMFQAVNSIPAGVTVQEKRGTFTTDSYGGASVDCGFKPDVISFSSDFTNDCTVSLIGVEIGKVLMPVAKSKTDSGYDLFATEHSETGFALVSCQHQSPDYGVSFNKDKTITYLAIKCT